jgi:uncharacterized NAD(P)/FAD-binding protein YdhS
MGALRSNLSGQHEKQHVSGSHKPVDVAIVGAGASGVLLALALAQHAPDVAVTLIDPALTCGRGLAYAEAPTAIRLNVGATRMSAFADRPNDFAAWCLEHGHCEGPLTHFFAPRDLYGSYLADRLAQWAPAIVHRRDAVADLQTDADGVTLTLASGARLHADIAVLATGHSWVTDRDHDRAVPVDAPVSIIGTGLTMVDRWLRLRDSGHRGVITANSRHGLAPLGHGAYSPPMSLSEVPLGRSVRETMRWLRQLAKSAPDWRVAVDGIRPFTQAIWQAWPLTEKRRFLRHARRYWDVHRHRIAPDVAARLDAERQAGTLRIVHSRTPVNGDHLFDCRGYVPDWSHLDNALISRLVATGQARPDPLGIGLDVTTTLDILDRDGTPQPRLLAVGPITRSRFWEIEAVPDIRVQVADLARRIGQQALARHTAH